MDSKLYFKITNAEENHNGFQYVNGLNVLNEPFKEEGTCVPGGFYFSDAENILKFIGYGIYLREITFPDTDPDFKIVRDPGGDKWRANKIILGKRYNLSEVSTFKYLIALGADIHANIRSVIYFVSQQGYFEVVKFLINKYVKREVDYIHSLRVACSAGHLEIVEFLAEKIGDSNIKPHLNFSVQCASEGGHLEVVKFLIEKGADCMSGDNYSIRYAAENGHLEVVKFLIEKGADFKAREDYAMRYAAKKGHLEVVKFLVEKGADVKKNGNHAINAASINNHNHVVKFILQCKSDKN